ncbi:AAA family ATPase [Streptomyces sp. NPDC048629]|uniref:helix-turn-helix transcriptional regulator n=1 Tax=Streptomyces sp. NPDC048629 TaxID=3154824 RepID=UPI0034305167
MTTQAAETVIGRAAEVELLTGLVRELADGRGGSVMIEGEPGIGKTTLMTWLAREAQQSGCRVLLASASEQGRRFPLHALLDGVGQAVLTDGAATPPGADAAAGAGSIPEMSELLRRPASAPDDGPGLSGEVFDNPTLVLVERMIDGITRLLDEGPLVLLLDDLHWADEATLLLWQRLGRATVRFPLLITAASRRESGYPELDALRRGLIDRGTRLLHLAPLPPEHVADLAASVLGAAPAPNLRDRLVPAGGNPLYVTELLDALRRGGDIEMATDGARLAERTTAAAEALPPLQAIVERFAFLTPATFDAMRTAAVLGAEFSAAELSVVSGHGPLELLAMLDEAVATGVVADRGERMRFRHALLHQALYNAIPEDERTTMHRAAAEALSRSRAAVERVAQQLLQVGTVGDDWTVAWLVERSHALTGRGPDVAVELFQRAIDHVPADDARRAQLEERLANAAFQLRNAECQVILRRLMEEAADPEVRASVTADLVHGLLWAGAWDDIVVLLDKADSSVPVEKWTGIFRAFRAQVAYARGDYDQAEPLAQDVIEWALRHGDDVTEAFGRHTLFCVQMRMRRTPDALAESARCVEVALRVPATHEGARINRDVLVTTYIFQGVMLGMLDRLGDALAALNEAERVSVEHGTHAQLSGVNMSRAVVHYWTGDWDAALSDLDAIADFPGIEWMPVLRYGLAALIHGLRDQGEEATAAAEQLKGRPDPSGAQRAHSSYRLMAGALLAEREGRPFEALALLLPTLDEEYARDLDQRYQWLADVVRLALSVGQQDTAQNAVAICEAEAARIPQPGRIAAAKRCRGLLEQDVALLLEAADYYEGAHRTFQAGQALEDAAAVAGALGDAAAARSHLARALDHYREVGALWTVTRVEARLKSLGVRLRQRGGRPSSGWEALTPAEAKVAKLVAEGFSNPRIAAELFLSPRTVQTHVSHILGKLGVGSRAEVARATAERATE